MKLSVWKSKRLFNDDKRPPSFDHNIFSLLFHKSNTFLCFFCFSIRCDLNLNLKWAMTILRTIFMVLVLVLVLSYPIRLIFMIIIRTLHSIRHLNSHVMWETTAKQNFEISLTLGLTEERNEREIRESYSRSKEYNGRRCVIDQLAKIEKKSKAITITMIVSV